MADQRLLVRRDRNGLVSRGTSVAVLVTVLLAMMSAPASAAFASLSRTPTLTWSVNGVVYALAEAGGRVYLGGSFTQLQSSANGGTTIAVHNLAAIDASTGQGIAGWNPNAINTNGGDATVYALAVSADGGTVYAGGAFNNVGSVKHNRLAAIDATTGAVSGWAVTSRS